MELIVSTDQLRNELRAFSGLVDKSNSLLELSNLLIEANDGKLSITGSDGDVSLRTEVGPDFYETVAEGATCIRSDKLLDMLGTLGPSIRSVRIKKEPNGWNSVHFGKSKFRVSGVESSLYPEIKTRPGEGASVAKFPSGLLLQFLSSTSHALSAQDTKYAISGANLTVKDGKAQMDATDGFKIASIKAQVPGDFNALFPRKVSSVLRRILSDASPEALVELASEPNFLFAKIGNKDFSFRRMVGDFPNIDSVIAVDNECEASVDLLLLQDAVRRADLFTDKANHSGVTLTIRPNEMEVHSRSFEVGSGNEVFDIQYSGEEVSLKINASHLLGFFSSIELPEGYDGPITLRVAFSKDEKKPTVWSLANVNSLESQFDYKCLITKLR